MEKHQAQSNTNKEPVKKVSNNGKNVSTAFANSVKSSSIQDSNVNYVHNRFANPMINDPFFKGTIPYFNDPFNLNRDKENVNNSLNNRTDFDNSDNQINNESSLQNSELNDNPKSNTSTKNPIDDIKNRFFGNNKSSNVLNSFFGNDFNLVKLIKYKYVIFGGGIFFVFILLMFIVVSAKEHGNLDMTNNSTSMGSASSNGALANTSNGKSYSSEQLLAKLEEVGKWYIENVNTYQGKGNGERIKYQTPFGTRGFGDDCTEFAVAYMSYVSGSDLKEVRSVEMVHHDGSWAQSAEGYGWKGYTTDEIDNLMPGDVLVANPAISYSRGHHAEIYIDENTTFGWGSVKSDYPTNNTLTKSIKDGHTIYSDWIGKSYQHDYVTIYRYQGVNNFNTNIDINNLNIIQKNDSSFNHGDKPRSNQKYIMLHDTEMKQDAETVVTSWKNTQKGIAAHFIVDRDGTVIQAVDLDVIAHHAGEGTYGKGSQYGVGADENGIAYGMNSHSVGIEICHVNGEDYPEVQLEALDQVIAYIDSYFGFQSTIIDHKAWRVTNSDTDIKFATYLEHYQKYRHHKG